MVRFLLVYLGVTPWVRSWSRRRGQEGHGTVDQLTILISGVSATAWQAYLLFFTYSFAGKFLKAQQWLG